MRSWLRIAPAAALALLLAPQAGCSSCKQGEGDYCQIDDDCRDGLRCNAGTMRCQGIGQGIVDSAPIIDGPPRPDAAVDAAPDAMPDAMPDAGDEDGGT